MKTRKLGNMEVSAIGMGCMGFTHAYGAAPEEKESIRLVHRAFDLGCNFFDTAEMYSYFKNEEFVGKALKELPRDKVIISDKFWPTPLPGTENDFPEGKLTEAGIRRSVEGALRRLQTEYIDLYTQHLMEEGSEEQVAYVMGKLIEEGKIRAWGQSSPTAEQIRKAHAVTPITAIQSEYSMMEHKKCGWIKPSAFSINYGSSFCVFREKYYICIELFDEMQSAAVQRSYMVAKSLPTSFFLSTQRCHSDSYAKVSYPFQR